VSYINTFTGKRVNPLALRPEEVDIIDIARSLSNKCRYNGHCGEFYSVAEHSFLITSTVSKEAKITALLHDATEAYFIGDVLRPIKRAIPEIERIEARVWSVIKEKFDLDGSHEDEVKEADNRILCTEVARFKRMGDFPCCQHVQPLDVRLIMMTPDQAFTAFLLAFKMHNG
jgi:hypothetical protein